MNALCALTAGSEGGNCLHLRLHANDYSEPQMSDVLLSEVVLASWTVRDPLILEQRLNEIEALGVQRPNQTPCLYEIAASRVTTSQKIQVLGDRTTGEVEFVILEYANQVWVGVGSDHTDRHMEQTGAALSKQLCDKPISRDFWNLTDVLSHWDSLLLRAYLLDEYGQRTLYQEGAVSSMLSPDALLQKRDQRMALAGGEQVRCSARVMFGGTLPTIGAIRSAPGFAFELEDTRYGRSLKHSYCVQQLGEAL